MAQHYNDKPLHSLQREALSAKDLSTPRFQPYKPSPETGAWTTAAQA